MDEKYVVDYDTLLGEGAYGRVHPATYLVDAGTTTNDGGGGGGRRAPPPRVALKKLSKRHADVVSSVRSETNALFRIYDNGGHPNISGLRDMYEDDG